MGAEVKMKVASLLCEFESGGFVFVIKTHQGSISAKKKKVYVV